MVDEFDDLFGGDDIFGDDAPDWLSDFAVGGDDQPDDEFSEVLQEQAASPLDEPSTPKPPVNEPNKPVDRLPPTGEDAAAAPSAVPEPKITEQVETLPEAKTVQQSKQPAASRVEQPQPNDIPVPEWLSAVAAPADEPGNPPPTPDWLLGIADSAPALEERPPTPEWLSTISELAPEAAASVPAPRVAESAAGAPQAEPQVTAADDWFSNIVNQLDTRLAQSGLLEKPPGFDEPAIELKAKQSVSEPVETTDASDGLKGGDEALDTTEEPSEVTADEPTNVAKQTDIPNTNDLDWLAEFDTLGASEKELGDAEQVDVDGSVTSWLKATQETAERQGEAASSETTNTPDWLKAATASSADKQITETGPLNTDDSSAEDNVPEWLKPLQTHDDDAAKPETRQKQAEQTGPLEEDAPDNIPDWLKDIDTPPHSEEAEAVDPQLFVDTTELPSLEAGGVDEREPTHASDTSELNPDDLKTDEVQLDEIIASNNAPATGELSAVVEDTIPDWLREPAQPDAEADRRADQALDWLATIGSSETTRSAQEEPAQDNADWLTQIEASSGEEPPAASDLDEDEAIPDWLKQDTGVLRPSRPSMEGTILEPDDEAPKIPEWITQATSELKLPDDKPTEPAAEPDDEEIPEWLAAVQASSGQQTEVVIEPDDDDQSIPAWISKATAELPAQPDSAEAPERDDDLPDSVPDWLAQAQDQKTASSQATPQQASDWLNQVGLGEAKTGQNDAPIPDWPVQQIEAGEGSDVPLSESPEQTLTETPDWLRTATGSTEQTSDSQPEAPAWLQQAQGLRDPADEPKTDENVPEWLRQADESAKKQPASVQEDTPAEETDNDWINSLGIDRITDDERRLRDAAEVIGVDVADVSAGASELRELSKSSKKWDSEDSSIRQMKINLDLASQIQDLRFADIVDKTDVADSETVGPLRNVKGAVRAEMIFEGGNLRVRDPIEKLIITDAQASRVDTLRKLMEGGDGVAAEAIGRRGGLALTERYLVTILLVIAIALPTLLGAVFLPAEVPVTSGVEAVRDTVRAAPDDATVLIAFEYEPNAQVEMEPMVVALLTELSERPDASVYAVSTKETGPAMAEQALASSPKQAEKIWNNLGYLPGEANAVRTLSEASIGGALIPFQVDVQGRLLETPAQSLAALDIDLLVIASSRPEALRIWLEQTTLTADAMAIGLVSQGTAPVAYPYQQSNQLDAVLVGFNDGVSYSTLVDSRRNTGLSPTWNGLGLGSTVAAALIIIGGVIYGLRALANEEQE